jgi:hypothetical protein
VPRSFFDRRLLYRGHLRELVEERSRCMRCEIECEIRLAVKQASGCSVTTKGREIICENSRRICETSRSTCIGRSGRIPRACERGSWIQRLESGRASYRYNRKIMSSLRSVELQPIAVASWTSTPTIGVREWLLSIWRRKALRGREGSSLLRRTGCNRNAIGSSRGTGITIRISTNGASKVACRDIGKTTLVTNSSLVSLNLTRSCLATGGAAASLVALDLCLNSAAIRSSANGRQIGTNGLNKTDLHLRVGVVESSLNDVVGERITEQAIKFAGLQHLLDQHILGGLLGTAEALLNDIRAKLLL